jgi:hypothetical protein
MVCACRTDNRGADLQTFAAYAVVMTLGAAELRDSLHPDVELPLTPL